MAEKNLLWHRHSKHKLPEYVDFSEVEPEPVNPEDIDITEEKIPAKNKNPSAGEITKTFLYFPFLCPQGVNRMKRIFRNYNGSAKDLAFLVPGMVGSLGANALGMYAFHNLTEGNGLETLALLAVTNYASHTYERLRNQSSKSQRINTLRVNLEQYLDPDNPYPYGHLEVKE